MACRIEQIPEQLKSIYSKISADTRFDNISISISDNKSILDIFTQYVAELGKNNSSELTAEQEVQFINDIYDLFSSFESNGNTDDMSSDVNDNDLEDIGQEMAFDNMDDFADFTDVDTLIGAEFDVNDDYDVMSDLIIEKDVLDIDFNDNDIIGSLTDVDVDDQPFFKGSASAVTVEKGINLLLKKVRGRVHDARVLLYKSRNMIRILESSLKNAETKEEISNIRKSIALHKEKIREINIQIIKTINKKTIENVNKLYDKYEDWMLSVLANKHISAAELMKVSKAIDTWQNISQIFDNGSKLDQDLIVELVNLEKRARNPEFVKITNIARDMLRNKGKSLTGLELSDEDLAQMEDIGWAGENVGNLHHVSNKVIALISKLIRGANSRVNIESNNAKKEIKEALKNWDKYKDLFKSTDANGKWDGNLVTRYTKKLYEERKFIREFIKDKVDAIIVKEADATKRQQKIKSVYQDRNTKIRDSFYIISSEDLSDTHALREKLTKIVGDEKYAEKLINEASFKLERFREERAEFIESLKLDSLSDENFQIAIQSYDNNFNPDSYIQYINNKNIADGDFRNFDDIDRFTTEVPLRVDRLGLETGFYDSRFYNTILNNEEAYDAHTAYHDLLRRYLSYLPSFVVDMIDGRFVPNCKKDMFNIIFRSGNENILGKLRDEALDSITVKDSEGLSYLDYDGKIKKSIPLKYLTNIDPNEKSDNIIENLIKFSEMAIKYKHLSIVEDYVNLGKMVVENMDPIKKMRDGSILKDGNMPIYNNEDGLAHITGLLNHAIDTNLYGRAINKEEGTTDIKITNKRKRGIKFIEVANPAPLVDKFLELEKKIGWEAAIDKMLKEDKHAVETNERESKKYITKVIDDTEWALQDDKIEQGDYDSKMKIYNAFLGKLGKNFSWRKFMDVFITAGAWKAFAYSPFPAMANIGFGWATIITHAAGREDFTPSEAISGMNKAFKSLLRSSRENGLENNKLLNLALKWGIIGESGETGGTAGGINTKILNPFGLLSSTDFWLRVNVMSSMLEHNKITDINGKERKLEEAFLDNGEWNVKEFGDNEDWNSSMDSLSGNKKLFDFISSVKDLNQELHGNFSDENAFKVKRSAVARAIAQFRLSWLADAIRSRVEVKRYSYQKGRNVEGRYRTFLQFTKKQGLAKTLGVMYKLMTFQGASAFDGVRIKTADKEMVIANIRKQMMEMYIIIAMLSATMLLKMSIDDDDEDSKSAKYIALNTANRVMTDITFFMNPMSFQQLTNNIIPSVGILTDGYRWIRAISKYSSDDPYWNGEKVFENTTRMFPVLRLYNTVMYNADRELLSKQ